MKPTNLYHYLGKKKWLLVLYLIVNPINSLLEILLAYATAAAIEYAIKGSIGNIFSYAAAFFVYIIVWLLFSSLHTIIRNKLLENAVINLKSDLMNRLIFSSPNDFNKQNTGTYIANFTSDIEIIRNSYFFKLLSIYGKIIQFTAALIALFYLNIIIGVFVIAMAIIQIFVPIIQKKRIVKLGEEYSRQQQNYTKVCKETLGSFSTTALFGIRENMSDFHKNAAQKAEMARSHSKIVNGIVNDVSFSVGNVMYLGIFVIGSALALKGYLEVGAIIAAAQLMVYIATPLTMISSDISELQASFKVANNLQNILNLKPQKYEGASKDTFDASLQIKNLSFSYNEKEVLHNLSCTFEKGKKYLIVGPSGSGKSTLLSLLTRQNKIQSGQINIDEISIESLSSKSMSDLILLNPQEPYLFDWSIADNIRLFQPVSDERIFELLEQVGLKEKINSLPNGLYSYFGENGANFSGGEKQRIGIVRALLRNPPILLMDECTAHLDALSARKIEELLLGLPNTTVIIVSHHPSQQLQQSVNEIFILKNNKLENGNLVY